MTLKGPSTSQTAKHDKSRGPSSSQTIQKSDSKRSAMGTKDKSSKDPVQALMEDTFEIRRSYITMEMPTISSLKTMYPNLFKGRQMLAEFQRITQIDIDHTIQEYCVKYAGNIIDSAKHLTGSKQIIQQAESVKQQNVALRQYWDMVTALCLLSHLLKENLVEMVREIGENDEVDPKGKIVPILISKGPLFKSDEFVLVVEEEIVQEFEEFTIAFATLFASYWVFNMQYPRTLNHTYNFIQKGILHLRDGTPIPPLCKQLLQRLQKAGPLSPKIAGKSKF